jgi:hypothetical protein
VAGSGEDGGTDEMLGGARERAMVVPPIEALP